jgi:F-type H+-transporting ATPase subunit epsilon
MTEKEFKLDIVTPRRVVYSGDVRSFSAPGVLGGFQVLYNHAPLLSAVGIGEVKLQDVEGYERRYATSGGFVEVVNNRVTMLAESAERSDEIDVTRADAARDRAEKRIQSRMHGIDIGRAKAALARAVNRLRVVQKG